MNVFYHGEAGLRRLQELVGDPTAAGRLGFDLVQTFLDLLAVFFFRKIPFSQLLNPARHKIDIG